MQNKYQRLAGNTVKLGLGTFGSKVLVFLMVRFYTEYLSPADYGTADLITQTANLLIPLLSLGITDAVFRFVIDEAEGAAGIFTTGFFVLLAGSVLAGLLALCGSAELDSAWLIAAFLIASNFHTLPAQFVRAKGEMTCFAVQGLLNTAFVIGLNILFLAVFRLGVTGYVLSTVAADVLTTAYLVLRANTAGVVIRFAGAPVWMLGYIFLSGAVAITAMVLPGISGSTILLVAGVYLPAIQAVKTFLSLDFSVFPGLCALGLGVLAGIGLSIHAIRAALRKYRSPMVWFILGLMAGSLYAIVMGPAGLDAPQAPVGPQTFDVLGFALGIAILLGLEALRRWTAQHPAPEAPRGKRATT